MKTRNHHNVEKTSVINIPLTIREVVVDTEIEKCATHKKIGKYTTIGT
jgi:hypothetical protein